MPSSEELEYAITSKAQLAALSQAISAIQSMSSTVDKMGDETKDTSKQVDDLNKELEETVKFGGRMKGSLGNIGNIAGKIGIGIGSIVGVVGAAMAATQEWSLGVERLSDQFSIGLDQASALAVSWERAGLSAEEGASIFSGLQGRLIGELEAQKEAQKELQSIQKERAGVVEEMASAEADYHKTIAELEKERASIGSDNIAERRKAAQKEVEDLRQEYARFVSDQEEMEREETATFQKIWEERARKFEEASGKLRGKFEEDSRKARNVREFLAVKKNFEEQRQLLVDNLNRENKEQTNSQQKAVSDRAAANEEEKQLMLEKSQAVAEAADRDVAKMEEANQKAVADLDARIAEEKAAYADRTADFQTRLGELDKTAQEAASTGGDLTFVMKELGVEVFDSDGKMRNFNDIIWDVQEALQGMEEGGRKAALIADLGLEDAAPWINRGTKEVDALRYAQEKGLVVTEQSLEAIHKQRDALNDMRLTALGYANALGLSDKANTLVIAGMEKTQAAIEIAKGLWDQLKTIVSLLWDRFLESLEVAKENLQQLGEIASLGLGKITDALGFGEEGIFSKASDFFGFSGDNKSADTEVSNSRTTADVIGGESRNNAGLTVNINSPVYGVEDIDRHISNAVTQYDRAYTGP